MGLGAWSDVRKNKVKSHSVWAFSFADGSEWFHWENEFRRKNRVGDTVVFIFRQESLQYPRHYRSAIPESKCVCVLGGKE